MSVVEVLHRLGAERDGRGRGAGSACRDAACPACRPAAPRCRRSGSRTARAFRPASTALAMLPTPDCSGSRSAGRRPIFTSCCRKSMMWPAMRLDVSSGAANRPSCGRAGGSRPPRSPWTGHSAGRARQCARCGCVIGMGLRCGGNGGAVVDVVHALQPRVVPGVHLQDDLVRPAPARSCCCPPTRTGSAGRRAARPATSTTATSSLPRKPNHATAPRATGGCRCTASRRR